MTKRKLVPTPFTHPGQFNIPSSAADRPFLDGMSADPPRAAPEAGHIVEGEKVAAFTRNWDPVGTIRNLESVEASAEKVAAPKSTGKKKPGGHAPRSKASSPYRANGPGHAPLDIGEFSVAKHLTNAQKTVNARADQRLREMFNDKPQKSMRDLPVTKIEGIPPKCPVQHLVETMPVLELPPRLSARFGDKVISETVSESEDYLGLMLEKEAKNRKPVDFHVDPLPTKKVEPGIVAGYDFSIPQEQADAKFLNDDPFSKTYFLVRATSTKGEVLWLASCYFTDGLLPARWTQTCEENFDSMKTAMETFTKAGKLGSEFTYEVLSTKLVLNAVITEVKLCPTRRSTKVVPTVPRARLFTS